jgi:prepilin-type N-terminal cleavage/methylation domain-containing protein
MDVPRLARHPAFTLIEVLVVMGIVSVLIGMIIPAAIRVREASNRLTCAGNLRQVGEAAHHYHDVNNQFPHAVQLYKPPKNGTLDILSMYRDDHKPVIGPNWAVLLLPYLELEAVYRAADTRKYMQRGDQRWRTIRSVSSSLLRCPSDSGHEILFNLPDRITTQQDLDKDGGWARGNYAINAGPGYFHFTQRGASSKPHLGGVAGINWGASLSQIAQEDGSANTRRPGSSPRLLNGVNPAVGFPD